MTTLKPCPFCGSTDVFMSRCPKGIPEHVECNSCHAEGPAARPGITEHAAWNAAPRHTTTSPGGRQLVKVCIAVAVDEDGTWGAYAWGHADWSLGTQSGAVAEAAIETAAPNGERCHVVWVHANVPLPPAPVQGEVTRG